MTHPPHQEHNTLSAIRGFLQNIANEDLTDVPDKVRLSARYFLKTYPSQERLNELYQGQTFTDLCCSCGTREAIPNPNRIVNDNQTWETPGFKWKSEVEFKPAQGIYQLVEPALQAGCQRFESAILHILRNVDFSVRIS